jgi:hypothetical protein
MSAASHPASKRRRRERAATVTFALLAFALLTFALLAFALLVLPGAVAASTLPGPSIPQCTLGVANLEAGTPLALSRRRATGEPVAVLGRRADGAAREFQAVTAAGTWRVDLVFGAADAGSWTIEVVVDGASCASQLTVTLPAGAVAPAILPIASEPAPDASTAGIDGSSLASTAPLAAAALVVASWIFLALLALVRVAGGQPLARRAVRRAARGAIVVATVGAGLAAWAIAYFMDGMAHFDSGIPPDQQRVLNAAFWGVIVLGVTVGMLAAGRLRAGMPGRDAT